MKYQIINKRVNVTDEEIDSFKNFDGILNKYYSKGSPIPNRLLRWQNLSWILGGTMIVVVTIITFYPSSKKINDHKSNKSINLSTNSNILQPDLPPPLSENKILEANKAENDFTKDTVVLEGVSDKEKIESPAPVEKPVSVEINEREEAVVVQSNDYEFIEAQPIDGLPLLYEYFETELQYPTSALRDSIEGTVIIQFTINKLGKPEEILIKKSLGKLFDEESIRVIENMPLWSPATVNGKPINSKLNVPLHFNFNNKQ